MTDIIDSLLGNRYNVTDRQAVRQCVNAARAEAGQQYGGNVSGGMRVTAISSVERRGNGLRVSGTLGSAYAGQYGNRISTAIGMAISTAISTATRMATRTAATARAMATVMPPPTSASAATLPIMAR